jgi:hypothetical protein
MKTDYQTWYQEAFEIADSFAWLSTQLSPIYPDVMDEIEYYYENGLYSHLAATALNLRHNGHHTRADIEELAELLERKQNDYGPNNILRFGLDGLKVRLWDKVARYRNLQNKDNSVIGETINDTLDDIVGYCVIEQMLHYGTFTLPTRQEKETNASRI